MAGPCGGGAGAKADFSVPYGSLARFLRLSTCVSKLQAACFNTSIASVSMSLNVEYTGKVQIVKRVVHIRRLGSERFPERVVQPHAG